MLGPLICKLRKRLPHYAKASRFASALGCTREHYRRIEAGTGFPSRALMTRIIAELEVGDDQADGLWIAWGLSSIPKGVSGNLLVLRRDQAGLQTTQAVLEELLLMYDLSPEDGEDLKKIITETLTKEETLWRA